jgi:hypothetical protein
MDYKAEMHKTWYFEEDQVTYIVKMISYNGKGVWGKCRITGWIDNDENNKEILKETPREYKGVFACRISRNQDGKCLTFNLKNEYNKPTRPYDAIER